MDMHDSTQMLFRYLSASALLGDLHGVEEDTEIASAAVEAWSQDPHGFRLCRILARALGGDPDRAQQALDARMAEQPEDGCAQVIQAILQARLNHPDWPSVLVRVLATSSEPVPRQAAQRILDLVHEATNSPGMPR